MYKILSDSGARAKERFM